MKLVMTRMLSFLYNIPSYVNTSPRLPREGGGLRLLRFCGRKITAYASLRAAAWILAFAGKTRRMAGNISIHRICGLSFIFLIIYTPLSTFSIFATIPTSDQPNIKILSDQMDCNQSHNVCVAKGNAIAEKLNDPKVKILKANQITAYFSKEGGTGPLQVSRLEAEGNAFFIIGDIIVQGKRGTYLAEEDIAEVFDDVKITNGKNQLDGNYAKVNMKTGHYSIKRGVEPVQALIFTKDSTQGTKKHGQEEEE